ncbi:hypothetical protein VOLCADRAFT_117221, partial [Volvox carteri f. nagariensis]
AAAAANILVLFWGPSAIRHTCAHAQHAQWQQQQRRQQRRPFSAGPEWLVGVAAGGQQVYGHGSGSAATTTPGTARGYAHSSSSSSSSTNSSRRGRATDGGGSGGSDGRAGSGDGGGSSRTDVLPLRAALRLLYKQVHPDLFHDQPLAKEENERSFKLLQEYVQLARGGDVRSPAARLPYRFSFYLREPPQPPLQQHVDAAESYTPTAPARPPLRPPPSATRPAAAAAAATSGDGGTASSAAATEVAGLHLVQITLPPPAISPAGAKELAAPTRKALVKLLAACGLATSGRGGGGGGGGAADGGREEDEDDGGPLSLAAFLPEAVEALRQVEAASTSDPAVRVANLRGAMRLRHQVMVSFADKRLPARSQVALLERLARVVDGVAGEVQLQGCHIVIGDRLGLDRLGQLCLPAADPEDATWTSFLTGADLDFVRQQRKNVQALRNLETQVARAVGVAQVFTSYGNLMEPSYRSFLERLAAAAAASGPVGGAAFATDVSLCIMPPLLTGHQGQQPPPPPCRLDDSTPGVVQVASDATADEVYRGVSQLGDRAQAAVQNHRRVETESRQLSDRTRQRLRLRSLTRDPRVSPDHFRRACCFLLDQSAALMPLLEGCSVRIGFANRLAPDGSCYIELAHNCEL